MSRDDKPVNRRRFFREGLRELLRPLAQAIEPIEKVTRELSRLDEQYSPPAPAPYHYEPEPQRHWLRPPGSKPEEQFLHDCSRSGECVRVCPANAIKIDYGYMEGNGAPYIDANEMACVLCDGLYCMASCPSGALQPTPREEIDIGTAVWHSDLCLRTQGQECTVCVDKCPVGEKAIRLTEGGTVEVIAEGCTGCGVCQHDCPTIPKSITVTPRSKLEADRHHTPEPYTD